MRHLATFLAAACITACALQDTTTPVPQPDTLILGRLAAVRELAEEPGVFELEIKAALPETMLAVMRREKRPIPQLEKDLDVKLRVTPDTVCVVDGTAADIGAFRVGQEIAAVPKSGTCAMVGSSLLLAEAGEFYQFKSYETHHLPRALQEMPASVVQRANPGRVNSAGMEQTPIPLAAGRILYFAAGLLPPVKEGEKPMGAVRPGMSDAAGGMQPWAVGGFRPYRVAWAADGWQEPRPVTFPGLADDASARVTWINEDETSCLVEVLSPSVPQMLGESTRPTADAPWGRVVKVEQAVGERVGDGQRLGTEGKSLVWTGYAEGGSDLWLASGGAAGQRLEPRINTLGSEWAPRVGPGNVLYFCREQRQLLFAGGLVREVRLAGRQRLPLLEAVPVKDGSLLFFRVPRYAPGMLEWDIAAAAKDGDGWGKPVLLDEWWPGQ